jgi:hypothetical protein
VSFLSFLFFLSSLYFNAALDVFLRCSTACGVVFVRCSVSVSRVAKPFLLLLEKGCEAVCVASLAVLASCGGCVCLCESCFCRVALRDSLAEWLRR